MVWGILGLYVLLITPLRIGAFFSWEPGLFRCAYGIMIWGAAVRGEVSVRRGEDGRLRMEPSLRRRKRKGRGGLLKRIGKPSEIQKTLRRMGRLCLFQARLDLGGQDAAGVALRTGALRAASALLPGARLRCRPVFGGKGAARVHCIVETRLGMLMIACLPGLADHFLAGRKEEKTAWNIPSGT